MVRSQGAGRENRLVTIRWEGERRRWPPAPNPAGDKERSRAGVWSQRKDRAREEVPVPAHTGTGRTRSHKCPNGGCGRCGAWTYGPRPLRRPDAPVRRSAQARSQRFRPATRASWARQQPMPPGTGARSGQSAADVPGEPWPERITPASLRHIGVVRTDTHYRRVEQMHPRQSYVSGSAIVLTCLPCISDTIATG
jgi:hypothetical protein